MALALQCLQARRQDLVVSQQTKIGASDRSVLIVHGGLVMMNQHKRELTLA